MKRFYSLDVLRGLAALAVVFWHWQHFFFFNGHEQVTGMRELYPFHSVASLLYSHGFMAVDLFFAISGFVFFWLYSTSIRARRVGVTRFMFLRLSRLYPLLFVMLMLIIVLQFTFRRLTGSYFVYPYNFRYQLIEHLTLLNVWSEAGQQSFNGPAWSLSAEMFLYVLFVLLCRFFTVRSWLLVAIVLFGEIVFDTFDFLAVRGIEPFFLGGLMYLAYRSILASGKLVVASRVIVPVTAVCWVVGCRVALSAISPHDLPVSLSWAEDWTQVIFERFAPIVVFPLTVLSLAIIETRRGHLGRRLAVIGDISFSSYLIHFPLQLAAVLFTSWLSLDRTLFYSPWTMIAFFAMLIPLSLCSHRFFEMPAQSFIRSRMSLRSPAPAPAT